MYFENKVFRHRSVDVVEMVSQFVNMVTIVCLLWTFLKESPPGAQTLHFGTFWTPDVVVNDGDADFQSEVEIMSGLHNRKEIWPRRTLALCYLCYKPTSLGRR